MMTRRSPWMEVLPPASAYFPPSNSNWQQLESQRRSGRWTEQENKLFENALAYVDENSPDRWQKVAEMIPGKTAADVLSNYRNLVDDVNHIEAGLVPFPYTPPSSSFILDWESSHGLNHAFCAAAAAGAGGKRSNARGAAAAVAADHERKKGVPWTEDEHRLFLMGLEKYGKGDWRNISRNYVVTRTPTQVASHAQKYFIRLNSGSKDKRRSSIHDITTVNIPENRTSSSPSHQPSELSMHSTSAMAAPAAAAAVNSNQHNEAASVFSSLMQPSYGLGSYRMRSQAQHLHRGGAVHNSMVGQDSMMFQMQTVQPHPHG